jgi:hypothetical protein
MKKLREFREWPLEQVEEVARMLYALAPFKRELWSDEYRWKSLARQAFEFLDNLHKACDEIAGQRSALNAQYDHAEARTAEADKLRDPAPFDKAVRYITGETRTDRALPKLKKVLRHNALGAGWEETEIEKTLEAKLIDWRKHGIPRREAMQLRADVEREWPLVIAAQNQARRKKSKKSS